ncbi:MAG: hypothetical protein PVG74_20615 [Desulfobacterales bacterium]
MEKHLIHSGLALLIVNLLICGFGNANEHKTTELNRKVAEMSSLQQGLSNKIALVEEKRVQLKQKMTQLEKEIKEEAERLQIESYLTAIRNPRIEFNLRLINLLFGYVTGLTERISYFENGYQTLDFFRQQAQDDLLMIKTLNDMEIEKLVAAINVVLDEFIPELSRPIFDTREVPSTDTEKIWNEIMKRPTANG